MNKIVFVSLFLLLVSLFSFGQKNLRIDPSLKARSPEGFVYRLSTQQARYLLERNIGQKDTSFFRYFMGAMTPDAVRALPEGHYLYTYVVDNQLHYSYMPVNPYCVYILDNHTDFLLQLRHELSDEQLTTARVSISGKPVRYDSLQKAYRITQSNREGVLAVGVGENTFYYAIKRVRDNSAYKRFKQKVVYRSPLKYVVVPATRVSTFTASLPVDIIQSVKWGRIYIDEYYRIRSAFKDLGNAVDRRDKGRYYDRSHYYRSSNKKVFTFFSKPKYKPGDTVRLKVYALKRNGKKWMNQPLKARLINSAETFYVGTAQPQQAGKGYDFSFQLHDTMKLKLDKDYIIEFHTPGNLLVGNAQFRLEEYELKKAIFQIESRSGEHIKGQPFALEFIAKDDNGLPMADTRAEITLTARWAKNVQTDTLFLPLLLWQHSTTVEGGTKKIQIPDSIFPAAQVAYSIKAVLYNGQRERREIDIDAVFFEEKMEVTHKVSAGILQIEALRNHIVQAVPATLKARDSYGYLLWDTVVSLPFHTRVNPHAAFYYVETEGKELRIDMGGIPAEPVCHTERNYDSLFIRVNNPHQFPFTYQVYRRNREILRGSDTALYAAVASNEKDLYYVALQWVWAGRVRQEIYQVPLANKMVQLNVMQPKTVYPGQEAEIKVTATDYKKRPVKDMDILAYAFSNKFGYHPAVTLPDFSKKQRMKTEINSFRETTPVKNTRNTLMNFPFWNRKMKLDSIPAFRFLYPGPFIEAISIPSDDSITQVAPFVTLDGALQDVQYVLLNNVPVYLGFTDSKVPYSFEVDIMSRQQRLQIRTRKHLVTIDSFPCRLYHKTMFSVDISRAMVGVTVESRPDSLNNRYQESDNLSPYILFLDQDKGMDKDYFDYAYVEDVHHRRIVRINPYAAGGYYAHSVGPLVVRGQQFRSLGYFDIDFEFEPYFSYSFRPQRVKMMSKPYPQMALGKCVSNLPALNDWVLTRKKMEAAYYDRPLLNGKETGIINNNDSNVQVLLSVELERPDTMHHAQSPLYIFLLRPDDSNYIDVYPGDTRDFYIAAGDYEIVSIEKGRVYRKTERLPVKEGGINFYRIKNMDTLDAAAVERMDSWFNRLYHTRKVNSEQQPNQVKNAMREWYYTGKGDKVTGTVLDENGEGVPGASVSVKDTRMGTITDIDGRFAMEIPLNVRYSGVLLIGGIGLKTKEVPVGRDLRIVLERDWDAELSEVRIYGSSPLWNSYTGSFSGIKAKDLSRRPVTEIARALDGASAGISVTSGGGQPGEGGGILIGGQAGLRSDQMPLIVINGQVYGGALAAIDPSIVETMEILKDAPAIAIYGARAAHGVILISTRKGALLPDNMKEFLEGPQPPMTEDLMASSIRSHFRDDAFWLPGLKTDQNGEVRFTVKFPDDITAWKTFFYATDASMHTGHSSGMIRSYKPVSASLHIPQFLVAGDTAQLIGKSVHYIPDTISVRTSYFKNDSLLSERQFALTQYYNDTLPLVAGDTGSVRLKYMLTKTDGYFDGEEKTIPIVPRGLGIARGAFLALDSRDTSFNLPQWTDDDTLHISATTSMLDVVLEEMGIIRRYKYLCNEQLASKVIALIEQQRLYEAMKKPMSKKDKDLIQEMVNILLERQNKEKLWGWWQEGATQYWISQHVVQALTSAAEMHYDIGRTDFNALLQPLVYLLERDSSYFDLQALRLLQTAGLQLDYEKYIRRQEQRRHLSLHTRFALIRLRQQLGLPYDKELLISKQEKDLFGNIYWKDTAACVYDNDLLTTLTALEIIQADSTIAIPAGRVVGWLLQQRGAQGWRNIYESSRIIVAIAKTIPLYDSAALRPLLTLSGGIHQVVDTFPFRSSFAPTENIRVHKKGAYPVYFSYYQQYRDTGNLDLGKHFVLSTRFIEQGKEVSELEAGKPVQLSVKVEVEKSAEFVLIDVPIPAACSYRTKQQSSKEYEIHREYDKDRVSIFCEKLPKGTYTYTINLLPRYTGHYTLNPAKAELMYFPLFYGREQIKQVKVR